MGSVQYGCQQLFWHYDIDTAVHDRLKAQNDVLLICTYRLGAD